MVSIQSAADEAAFTAYLAARDDIRNVLKHGVYPNAVKALEVLTACLQQHGPAPAGHSTAPIFGRCTRQA